MELAKEDRHKMTFATEWGLFRYLRVPQGYLSSGDSYTKHTDAILATCPDESVSNKIIDDIIQWSDNLEQAFFRICVILSHCNQNGMVFSPEKFEFTKETVEFAGFKITMEGIKPTDKYVEAIRNFPTPTNIREVRGFSGSSIKWPTVSSRKNTWLHSVIYSEGQHPSSGTMTWRSRSRGARTRSRS